MGLWLCPSMMCADFGNMEREITCLDACGVDYYHLDVMDGNFVRNFGMGMQDIEFISRKTTAKTEVHLMICEPLNFVDRFIEIGVDRIFIHPESTYHPARILQEISAKGAESGLVIGPDTSVESTYELLKVADTVLVMMVHPGFAGQGYLSFVEDKIDKLLELKAHCGFEIVLDGACSYEVIKRYYAKGVKGFVLGTAGLFFKQNRQPDKNTIARLRELENTANERPE